MKNVLKILAGVFMLVTAAVGYIPTPELLVEFTCLTNTLGGILLILDGCLGFKGKSVSSILYLNVCAGILFVFLVCLGSLSGMYHMNYSGAFFFLHATNPVLIILFYIITCVTVKAELKGTVKQILLSPVLTLAYLLFDFILGKCRGYFVYGFVGPEQLSFVTALIVGLIMYVVILLFGWLLFALNRLCHK